MDGRIKIVVDDENDFNFFAELLQDAIGNDGTETLVNTISQSGTDEDWEEFVKPDLISQFKKDILTVSQTLAGVQDSTEKEFFISPENARDWYSTLNQARLNLEYRYKVSSIPPEVNKEELGLETIQAGIKTEFYMQIQGLILETMEF